MHWGYWWSWGMGLGLIFMIVFWILIILGIVYLVRLIIGAEKRGAREDSALDILKKRYANGEITKEEFEEKKKDII